MQKGRVKPTSGLNLRLEPNGDKIDVLTHDEEFEIVDEVTFYRVKTHDGRMGYVHSDYVEKQPTTELLAESSGDGFSREFRQTLFAHETFVGDAVRTDQDFVPDLRRIAEYATTCNIKIWVTSSLRPLNNQVRGAIVKPAKNSCHHIGHAIDMNVMTDGVLYNSKKLKKSNHHNLPDNIVQFINLIREDNVLRWGGDFTREDPVHIDNNFFREQPDYYRAKIDHRVRLANA